MIAGPLAVSWHTITHDGVALLTDEGDLFPLGGEPICTKRVRADEVDCAGEDDGLLYARGNARWTLSWTRIVHFDAEVIAYPHTVGLTTYPTPHAECQAYVQSHCEAVSEAAADLVWNGTTYTAVVDVTGRSEETFAVFEYRATMTKWIPA